MSTLLMKSPAVLSSRMMVRFFQWLLDQLLRLRKPKPRLRLQIKLQT